MQHQPDDVVNNHRRLVAVQIGKLVGLMVGQHQNSCLRDEASL